MSTPKTQTVKKVKSTATPVAAPAPAPAPAPVKIVEPVVVATPAPVAVKIATKKAAKATPAPVAPVVVAPVVVVPVAAAAVEGSKGRTFTGYMQFAIDTRASIQTEFPLFKFTDISKELGKRWKLLSDADKLVWTTKGKLTVLVSKPKKASKAKAAEVAVDETKKTKKSKKVKSDKPLVKRSKNAYMFYLDDKRATVKAELLAAGLTASVTDVTKKVAGYWGALSEAEKGVYFAKAKAAKEALVQA